MIDPSPELVHQLYAKLFREDENSMNDARRYPRKKTPVPIPELGFYGRNLMEESRPVDLLQPSTGVVRSIARELVEQR